ncbi:MAG: endo-1,4-beta-xylanase [Rhizomicrobium sp.]
MLSRRAFAGGLAASTVAMPATAQWLRGAVDDETPTLRALAASRGLLFGAANNNYWLRDADFAAAVGRDCGILVPEYELKREVTEPSPGQYDFSAPDQLLAFAQKHAMLFRGHPLVWYAANPPWLESAVGAVADEAIFIDYIRRVASHYRGRMHSWDVVNEAIEPKDGRADGLRDCFWLQRFGPSYIDHAFQAARAADPGALLVYNDYGLEQDGPVNDARRAATLKLLEGLLARGVPVGALGLQAHINAFGRTIGARSLGAFLDTIKAMGLRILVTEHDVDDTGGPADIASRDRAVADATRRLLDIVLANSATIAVLTWGYSDRFLKAESVHDQLLRGNPRSLPMDADMRPTPMRAALARAFIGAPKR